MDASVKQVKALKLELEALEGKVENARLLEASNASLMREFVDERSAMEMHIASMEEKIASLEEELEAKRDKASSTEKALEEMAALDAVWAQYVEEAASAKKLDGELQTMAAKLADAEASRLKSASQNEDTWAKQIRLLPSQTSSLAMQLKEEANDKARKSKEKMKDYEAKVESMQGTLMQSSTNVLARVNELAPANEQASLAMAEQTNKNERLQSELDCDRKEMSDSLGKANVKITQRGAVLERKERMLAELQHKYDSVLDQMERASASAKETIKLQAERLMTVEASGSKEKSALAAQISQLTKEITLVRSDVQKTITALNSDIKYMAQEINQERRLRDEAMKNKSGLEQSLMLAVQNAEKATRDKSLEMEQMSLQITKSNAAAAGESEKSRRLLLDLKEMSNSLNKADGQIKQRDDALRTKENEISGLQRDNQQLLGDIKKVQVSDFFLKSNRDEHLRDLLLHAKLLAVPLQDSVEEDALELIVKRNGEEEANKGMSTQSSKAGHQETKELAPGKERYRSLTARRGKGDTSSAPEKGKIVKGNVSGDKKRILPPKKTKYSSKAFISNGLGDKGITPDKEKGSQETYKSRDNIGISIYHEGNVENANKSYKTMEKKRDTTDCVISGIATGRALASKCDIFACKSTHDLTTQTLCQFMWHKWFAFCIYNMCLANIYAAYLTLNGCKKHMTALINTFMSTNVSETNGCITNSFTAKFTAMKHTIIHVLSSVSRLLAPHMMPVKVQRRRFFKRSSTFIILAVVFTVSIIAESQAQQVSSQFCVLLLPSSSSSYQHMHPHISLCND